ncbi:MAG: HAD family hydrolase [Odoribacter sp.]|nr:HAD family hydrolase [Odoribacter sp.]
MQKQNKKTYKNIVWDWNGTLVNDIQKNHTTLNNMLKRRGLKEFTIEEYKQHFTFPVENFYKLANFDFQKESMHEISLDFVNTYDSLDIPTPLTQNAYEILNTLHTAGYKLYILSALRQDFLHQMLKEFGIAHFFSTACGSDNIYATSKIARGQKMVNECGINPAETLMIGDTVHDAEVAHSLGFDCILYTGGHNSKKRLQKQAPIIDNLQQLTNYLDI